MRRERTQHSKRISILLIVLILGFCVLVGLWFSVLKTYFYGSDKNTDIVTQAEKQELPKLDELHNIVKIFMHERGTYTVWVQEDPTKEIQIYTFCAGLGGDEHLIPEELVDGKAYLRYKLTEPNRGLTKGYIYTKVFEIHGNLDMITGAGWDHGKHGSGRTNVIFTAGENNDN